MWSANLAQERSPQVSVIRSWVQTRRRFEKCIIPFALQFEASGLLIC